MNEYIERKAARELFRKEGEIAEYKGVIRLVVPVSIIDELLTADVVEVEKLTPCDVCMYGPPSSCDGKPCCMCPAVAKMDGKGGDDDKPKTTCLNCKHLMFSDMYGECGLQLRIVRPSDTCEYAEPKDGKDGDAE